MFTFVNMKENTIPNTQHVRIKSSIVIKVSKNKDKTGVPIGKFFEDAALEKLGRRKKKTPTELQLWDFLSKTLSSLDDNNYTARLIYDKIQSLSPILFK